MLHPPSTLRRFLCLSFFFFNDTATTEIYTLSLHDALPICGERHDFACIGDGRSRGHAAIYGHGRSEEHTSELQSHLNLVCRLLLEKKKKSKDRINTTTTTRIRISEYQST